MKWNYFWSTIWRPEACKSFTTIFWQHSVWFRYSLLKYKPILEFANMMNYTAMGVGNHDFDDGVEGLVPFIEGANFPVLASNINASAAPDLVNRYSISLLTA